MGYVDELTEVFYVSFLRLASSFIYFMHSTLTTSWQIYYPDHDTSIIMALHAAFVCVFVSVQMKHLAKTYLA